jgi:hypothetical protein
VSAGRSTPRDTPPNLARRGEIATKTQELRPALSVNTQPNHVLPLAHFGATSDVACDGGVVRTDHHNAGERSGSTQQYDLKAHHAYVGGWSGPSQVRHLPQPCGRRARGLGSEGVSRAGINKPRPSCPNCLVTYIYKLANWEGHPGLL